MNLLSAFSPLRAGPFSANLQPPPCRSTAGFRCEALSALGGGPLVGLPALPLEFGANRARLELTRQPPRIGEHGPEVLREAGFAAAEISGLMVTGVLGRDAA